MRRRSPASATSFNAATTRRPWRTRIGVATAADYRQLQCGHGPKAVENCRETRHGLPQATASMRPRPEGRGEPGADATLQERHARGFNAATARRPWRTTEQR